MNEKLQYAEMLNIPVNTSTVTYKVKKKPLFKRYKNDDKVKEELIAKVNSENGVVLHEIAPETVEPENEVKPLIEAENEQTNESVLPVDYQPTVSITKAKKCKKAELKVNVVGVQLVVIGILAAIICLTSALVPNSGINVFFREVFGKSQAEDTRGYEDFSATVPVSTSLSINDGVMTMSGKASVYPPCDGILTSLIKEQTGKYTMTITHSENFKTVISGVDYAYAEQGGSVFKNVPVGYVKESATLCFKDGDDSLITGYGLNGDAVVWAV